MAWPRVSKKGFLLKASGPQMLLLHGYTGSPYDLRPMGDFFHKRGFHICAPLLAGHGGKPSDLHKIVAKDWTDQARDIISDFDSSKPIIVAGLSMGALIGLLVAKAQKIDALVLCSPALRLSATAEVTLFTAELGLIDRNTSIKKFSGSDIADPIAKEKTPAYKEIPISGLLEFAKIRRLAQKELMHISSPIFLAFGQKDQAIDAVSSRQMILSSCSKATIFAKTYENSKHVITLDYDKDRLFLDIEQFLHQQLGI